MNSCVMNIMLTYLFAFIIHILTPNAIAFALDPTLRRFRVLPLSYVSARNWCSGREQFD